MLFFIVYGFLPKNRLAVMSMPPGDASFSVQFSRFYYEPPDGEGGPTRRRVMVIPVLCVSRIFVVLDFLVGFLILGNSLCHRIVIIMMCGN